MRKVIMLMMAVLFIIGGCSIGFEKKEKLSSNENITIILERSGAFTMPEYSISKYTITSEGVKYETFYYNMTQSGESFVKFENGEYKSILAEFANLDDIKAEYNSEVMVADVGKGVIEIHEGEDVRKITIDPYITKGNPEKIIQMMDELQKVVSLAKDPIEHTVTLSYSGVQCEESPWDSWYSEGEINFIKAPTESELIVAYYSSKDIEILNLSSKAQMVCEACGCPESITYDVQVYKYAIADMQDDGWQ